MDKILIWGAVVLGVLVAVCLLKLFVDGRALRREAELHTRRIVQDYERTDQDAHQEREPRAK